MDLPQVMENTGSLLGEKKQENYSVALILRFVVLKTLKYLFDLWNFQLKREYFFNEYSVYPYFYISFTFL